MAGTQPALHPVTLGSLASILGATCDASLSRLTVHSLCTDSRQSAPGALFFAIPGAAANGADFIRAALRAGAVAVVTQDPTPEGVPALRVQNVRLAKSLAAHAFHGHPSRELDCIGVTGTNGKTTTCSVLSHVLRAAGRRPSQIGTLGADLAGGQESLAVQNTTPDALLLAAWLRRSVDLGAQAAVLEVSSHALEQERVSGIDFDVALFTQLSREHLDYHGDVAAYREAKAKLFSRLKTDAVAVLNAEDPTSLEYAARTAARLVTYGLCPGSDVLARNVRPGDGGMEFELVAAGAVAPVRLPLIGRHNLMNALAAAAAALELDLGVDQVAEALRSVAPVPGRLQPVSGSSSFRVVVDYAHTDDALEKVLAALRGQVQGRLIVVFGCGGERDRSKRPRMGRVACRLGDEVYVTSDNPRGESPHGIIEDILRGVTGQRVHVEPDRRTAIQRALRAAREGDLVLIAGKGHETIQIVGESKLPFDDRVVAEEVLWELSH